MLARINKTALFLLLASGIILNACSEATSALEDEVLSNIEVNTVEDLHAPFDRSNPDSTPFVYFNLRTGETVSADQADSENWDIAFRGTTIITNSGVNGPGQSGAIMLDVAFDEVTIAPSDGYKEDTEENTAITGSGGWYTYTGEGNPPRAVIAHEDVTIVLRTAGGNNYAKLHIMSYYKGNPDYDSEEFANLQTRPASQHFTFRYVIQLTEGLRDLK